MIFGERETGNMCCCFAVVVDVDVDLFSLLFVAMFQLFAEVHSFLLLVELELFLLRGLECGDGEGGLFLLGRHFGEA